MLRLPPLAILASLLLLPVPAVLASSQNDAGLGIDAPGSSPFAVDIAPGTYTAAVLYSSGDKEDWFRVTAPADAMLRLTFRALTGGLYGGVYRDDSSFVGNSFSSGTTKTILASGSTAYRLGFGNQGGSGSSSYTFTVEVIVQNDAGTGADAPGSSNLAVNVPLGTHAGQVLYAVGDKEDWFRVTVPAGSALRVTFAALSGGLYGGVYNDDSSLVGNAYSAGSTRTLYAGGGTAYRLGFGDQSGSGTATYTFTAEVITQDDAGTGADAPNNAAAAVALTPGSYVGQVIYSAGDKEDWYRVSAPVDAKLRLIFSATSGSLYGGIHRDDDSLVKNAFSTGDLIVLEATGSTTYRLGLGNSAGTGIAHYAFTVEVIPQDDAGLGGDAPNVLPAAVDLVAGTYVGMLAYDGGDKEDWYRFTQAPCGGVVLTVRATSGGLYAGIYNDQGGFITNAFTNGNTLTLTVATNGPFRIGLGSQAGVGLADYVFTLANGPRQSDAGLGCDAADSLAAANDIAPGAFSGALPYHQFDKEDWYRVTVPECSVVEIRFRTTAGSMYGGIYTDEGRLLHNGYSGRSTNIVLAKTGTFRLGFGDASGTGDAAYTFSVRVLHDGNEHGGASCITSHEVSYGVPLFVV